MKKKTHIVVFVTVPSPGEARRIAEGLIARRLAACVNIIGGVQSVFRWRGKVDHARESLLVIKTSAAKFPALRRGVASLHSYEVPEIIALPITAGNEPYLRWINESVGNTG